MRDCNTCQHLRSYTTGQDEYPPGAYTAYCAKDHWQTDPGELDTEPECVDYTETEEAYYYRLEQEQLAQEQAAIDGGY